jgi:hypothetical protein
MVSGSRMGDAQYNGQGPQRQPFQPLALQERKPSLKQRLAQRAVMVSGSSNHRFAVWRRAEWVAMGGGSGKPFNSRFICAHANLALQERRLSHFHQVSIHPSPPE